ncbi:NAD-dependent epimerase/dehydratase family protein [Thermoanaerobacterium thermosaccharolyticum]|uniref:NAD-dependent epimerase/dehydratase family protein n=1 Tax=Thermoanaerobacterium thermosaccharolyticum TaxID=1517 RepID=UPI00178607F3|nr:NAD-dependent epimerase/dehydratase [Thermoanaerobacterium thermosaccharolyticum]MBE0067687.1 NAD(P)-dependent oxidoreductase [Thermoanaerobacterium thermosaccharolyticum]MBE0228510.1 NAD(P)-dependent oxidoreductase [Thermoanaerobacterium thermosaccharolyticum]
MQKAIVTGANGFIGSWLTKELIKNNVEVIAIVRNKNSNIDFLPKQVRIIYCELESISDLVKMISDRNIDVFYHLAWDGTAGKDRADYSLQLLNSKYTCDSAVVAKELNCQKFICTGTITEKIAENILNIDSKAENIIYGIAKHVAHCLLDVLCKKIQLPYVWARLSNIYGENNSTGNIISYTLNEFQKGNKPTFSKAEQPYDLMYVKDAAKALYLLGEMATKENCYFIGSGEPRLLKEYLISIKDIFGNDAQIGIGERPEDGLKYSFDWFDTSALQRDTGFKVLNTFEYNIREIIEESKKKL